MGIEVLLDVVIDGLASGHRPAFPLDPSVSRPISLRGSPEAGSGSGACPSALG
jgi:hypothetical protein